MKTTRIIFFLLINYLASSLSNVCLAVDIEFATPNFHGIAPPVSPVDETVAEPPVGTTLQEYMNLDIDTQRNFVITLKNNLTAQIRDKYPARALCVKNLFNDSADGIQQLDNLVDAVKRAANQNMDHSAEKLTELLIAAHYCPSSLKLKQNSLKKYMRMDNRAQNILIINTQGHIITQLRDSDPGRAACVEKLFDNNDEGIKRFNVVKATLVDAANKNISNSAEVVTELVLTKHFCPPTSTDSNN